MSENIEKGQIFVMLAEIYGEDLSESRLRAYLIALNDLSLAEIKTAFDLCVKDETVYKLPTPAKLRALVRPSLDPKQEAIRLVEALKSAIKKYGWANGGEAEKSLDPKLWKVIERLGGWHYICTNEAANLNDQIIYAQIRDNITAIVTGERKNINPITGEALPHKITDLLESTLKSLPKL